MNKKITVEDILDKEPCEEWTEERLRAKIGEGKTLLEILDMEDVSANNRIWCVAQFLDEKTNRAFAIWCARQCKFNIKEHNEYIDVIEKFYNNEATLEELQEADYKAYEASNMAEDRAAFFGLSVFSTGHTTDDTAFGLAYWSTNIMGNGSTRNKQIAKLKEMINNG